jgi:hypothetical protein
VANGTWKASDEGRRWTRSDGVRLEAAPTTPSGQRVIRWVVVYGDGAKQFLAFGPAKESMVYVDRRCPAS